MPRDGSGVYGRVGRKTGMSDADLGSGWTYQYDPNGNLLESVDPRGSSGTVWSGYDGLNHPLWRNSTNSPSGAYVSYSYDTAPNGKGRLATESFNQGASLGAGSYSYTYDARGQVTAETVTLDGTSFPLGFGYNDAGQPQSVTYSDGESFALSYTGYGWQAQTTPSGGSAVPLATQIGYNGTAGAAAGHPTSALLASGTYYTAATYDNDLRLTYQGLALQSTGTALYETSRGYDGVGNVTSVQTLLAAGTDNQSFCYDEQNRLTWATSQSAAGPNGCASNTAGSLTGGGSQYTASYTYDALNRLTSSPLGSYSYGSSHPHAVSSVTQGSSTVYRAQYGTAGSMDCRAASASSTCEGSTYSGAKMSYDAQGQLIGWQNTWSNPTQTAAYAYDGAGQRVAQQVTSGGSPGTTSTTWYIGGGLGVLEEVTQSGSTTTLTKYESVPGLCSVVITGSGPSESLSYVATDGLGSVSEAQGRGHECPGDVPPYVW